MESVCLSVPVLSHHLLLAGVPSGLKYPVPKYQSEKHGSKRGDGKESWWKDERWSYILFLTNVVKSLKHIFPTPGIRCFQWHDSDSLAPAVIFLVVWENQCLAGTLQFMSHIKCINGLKSLAICSFMDKKELLISIPPPPYSLHWGCCFFCFCALHLYTDSLSCIKSRNKMKYVSKGSLQS